MMKKIKTIATISLSLGASKTAIRYLFPPSPPHSTNLETEQRADRAKGDFFPFQQGGYDFTLFVELFTKADAYIHQQEEYNVMNLNTLLTGFDQELRNLKDYVGTHLKRHKGIFPRDIREYNHRIAVVEKTIIKIGKLREALVVEGGTSGSYKKNGHQV